MGRVITAIFLFILVWGICIFEGGYLKNQSEKYYKKLENINTLWEQDKTKQVILKAKELENDWEDTQNVLCHFISFNALDTVGEEISILENTAKYETSEVKIITKKIEVLLKDINAREEYKVF